MGSEETAIGADSPSSQSRKAYHMIEEMIVRQELPPGSIISKQLLSTKLGIGLTPIREALQLLEREGLVGIVPRRGVIVTEISAARQLELLEVRRELERLVARCAARRASAALRERMTLVAAEIEAAAKAGDGWWFTRTAWDFHGLPVAAAANAYLTKTLRLLHGQSRRYWFAYYETHANLSDAATAHADRLRAIASGDEEEAARATDRLMDYLEAFVRATLRPSDWSTRRL